MHLDEADEHGELDAVVHGHPDEVLGVFNVTERGYTEVRHGGTARALGLTRLQNTLDQARYAALTLSHDAYAIGVLPCLIE